MPSTTKTESQKKRKDAAAEQKPKKTVSAKVATKDAKGKASRSGKTAQSAALQPKAASLPGDGAAAGPDATAGDAALARLTPALEAMPASAVRVPRTDAGEAIVFALGVAERELTPALRERLALMVPAGFDLACTEGLGDAALATWSARARVSLLPASTSEARVPKDLVDKAWAHRARMLKVADYHLGDDATVAGELVIIRSGSGYVDLADDLTRLATLHDCHAAVLALDRRYYLSTDAATARALARAILGELSVSRAEELVQARDLFYRAWTHLVTQYDEVAAAARWLLRHEDGETRFPSLHAAARAASGNKTRRTETPEPQPVAPAPQSPA